MSISVPPGSQGLGDIPVATKTYENVEYPIYANGITSIVNSSSTLLLDTETFTGEWEDVEHFSNVSVAVTTDQDGYYQVQFSPDGINQDSTLTRYYRTAQFNVPHNFVIARRYCRVVFYNNSGSNQTYFRLQTMYGNKGQLNVPCDSIVAQSYDATVVRPTDYMEEVALGLRQGCTLWNKFGYNSDVDVGTELIANHPALAAGLTLHTTASTWTLVSDSTDDDSGGTGCNSLVLYGVDSNWDFAIEVVTLDGTTPVASTTSWLSYPNRIAMYLCGTGQTNAGNITCTRTTGGAVVGYLAAGEGVTQQCIFTIAQHHQFMTDWLFLSASRQAAQNPFVIFKFWVYSAINNGKQEVLRYAMNTAVTLDKEFTPRYPFPIGEKSICWIEATTDKADTSVTARFSGNVIRDSDA